LKDLLEAVGNVAADLLRFRQTKVRGGKLCCECDDAVFVSALVDNLRRLSHAVELKQPSGHRVRVRERMSVRNSDPCAYAETSLPFAAVYARTIPKSPMSRKVTS